MDPFTQFAKDFMLSDWMSALDYAVSVGFTVSPTSIEWLEYLDDQKSKRTARSHAATLDDNSTPRDKALALREVAFSNLMVKAYRDELSVKDLITTIQYCDRITSASDVEEATETLGIANNKIKTLLPWQND